MDTVRSDPRVEIAENCEALPGRATNIICKCTKSNCSDLQFDWPNSKGDVVLIESTRGGLRFKATKLEAPVRGDQDTADLSTISVNLSSKHQQIIGFGGAFTDAATININSLSQAMADHLLSSYFGPSGLQYSLGRVPLGGSDFSLRAYSYDDANETDLELNHWALAPEDLDHKIPIIKGALRLNPNLKLFASPWSPPKWMKTSNNFRRGHLIDRDEIYQSYANYLMKFFEAYKAHGVHFWGATLQNEPVVSYLPFYFFNSLQMSHKESKRLIVEHLGPALKAKGYTKEKFKLMVGDDSLLFVDSLVKSLLDDVEVRKYVSAFAFHWYNSGLTAPYSSLNKLIDSVQDKIEFVVMSEACNGAMTMWEKHVDLGNWDRGEAYAIDIIEDMRRRTNAWVDWNMALDEQGGPNWAKNFADSPIIVNKAKDEFYKQPMYYALAHFSRFFRPNSVIVSSELLNPGYLDKIMVLAAHDTEGGHVIINILNKSINSRRLRLEVNNKPGDKQLLRLNSITVKPKSINTVVIKL